MATYGMQLLDSTGSVYYDPSSVGGIFVEFLQLIITGNSGDQYIYYNGTNSRADLKGMELKVLVMSSGDIWYQTFYGGTNGYPYIRYREANPTLPTYRRYGSKLLVMAR